MTTTLMTIKIINIILSIICFTIFISYIMAGFITNDAGKTYTAHSYFFTSLIFLFEIAFIKDFSITILIIGTFIGFVLLVFELVLDFLPNQKDNQSKD